MNRKQLLLVYLYFLIEKEVKIMSRDPKLVLEMFQIGEDEDQLLEPVSHHIRQPVHKKSSEVQQMSQAAVLSLCLVTGLTAGAGSAFAKGNILPDESAVDQVPWSTEQPSKVKVKPNLPPVDHEKSQTPNRIIQPDVDSGGDVIPLTPSAPSKPKHSSSTSPENEEKVDGSIDEPKVEDSVPSTGSNKEENPSHSSNKKKEEYRLPAYQKTKSIQSKQASSTSSELKHGKTVNPSSSAQLPATSESSTPLPKTEKGGELPQTAGNDLEGVVGGSVTALLAGWYLFQNRKVKPQ